MAYALTIDDKGTYVHFTVTGPNTLPDATACLSECASICLRMGRRHALIHDQFKGTDLDLEEIESLITLLGMAARSAVDSIAYVVTDPSRDRAILRFAENLAAVRRINARVFRTLADAEEWIRHYSRETS